MSDTKEIVDQESVDAMEGVQEPGQESGQGHDMGDGAGGFFGSRGNSNNKPQVEMVDYKYNMNHRKRGRFIIINNKSFDPNTGMGERSGTDEDEQNLHYLFKGYGFSVQIEKDKRTSDMLRIMKRAAKEDHSDSDCFMCAILSHGDTGVVYGTDGKINVEDLVAPFKGNLCSSLAGKPKIFIIQACRGNTLDVGVTKSDAAGGNQIQPQRIPVEADFLYAYSTVAGYFAWRNSAQGSWFVQALVTVFKEHGHHLEIIDLLTRVNKVVAYAFQSNSNRESMNNKKQVPSIVSMLTHQLYFPE